jgi:23S rRNA (cytosine1962-C5)-methyltransferase
VAHAPDPARPTVEGLAANLLVSDGWEGYALLDSGGGRKLERFGRIVVDRPEPQALWAPSDPAAWAKADARFDAGEDDERGAWKPRAGGRLPEWLLRYDDLTLICRATSFRHVGVFPEQKSHWDWMAHRIRAAGRPVNVLNLFGYTGVASLIAAEAGGSVTHVDASKKSITWARENQEASGLADRPIRWICDDALKFAEREGRRGRTYDAIVLDPPAYGRGPDGEVWRLFEDLPRMLSACAAILSDRPVFVILTAYALRLSYLTLNELLRDALKGRAGGFEAGELVMRQRAAGRLLSLSLYARWTPEAGR